MEQLRLDSGTCVMASSVFKEPRSVIDFCHRVKRRFRPYRAIRPGISVAFEPVILIGRQLLAGSLTWFRSVFGRPYTSGTPVTVTEEVISPTTFGGSQDVMIAVTWTSQVSRLWRDSHSRRIRFLSAVISAYGQDTRDIAPITERHETTTFG